MNDLNPQAGLTVRQSARDGPGITGLTRRLQLECQKRKWARLELREFLDRALPWVTAHPSAVLVQGAKLASPLAVISCKNMAIHNFKGETMRSVAVFEAKNKFSELLNAVEHGEEITITRHGAPGRG